MISQADLEELQEILFEQTGRKMSTEETNAIGIRLTALALAVYQTNNKYENKRLQTNTPE